MTASDTGNILSVRLCAYKLIRQAWCLNSAESKVGTSQQQHCLLHAQLCSEHATQCCAHQLEGIGCIRRTTAAIIILYIVKPRELRTASVKRDKICIVTRKENCW